MNLFDSESARGSIGYMSSRFFTKRLPKRAVLICALLGLAACRVEIGKDPNRFPTPTPTPTPTPAAVAASSLSAEPMAVSSEGPLSARVAAASAEFFEGATTAAAEETASVRRALSRAAEAPASAADQLREARQSLSSAADAYRKAEAAVFLVDPTSVEELRAQPDPLLAGSPGQRDETMEELISSLQKIDDLLSRPLGQTKAAALLAESDLVGAKIDKLEQGLRGMADAWKPDNAENFRAKFFLSSSDQAVARVFQGLLAMSGDLLPGRLAADQGDATEVFARVKAMQELYVGNTDGTEDRSSIYALVQQASPVQAALTRASIARSAALAGVLDLAPGDEPCREQLRSSFADVTRQLTFAAQSIGIQVIEQDD